jgi:hypothetical protein
LDVGLTTPPSKTIFVATPLKEPRIDGFFLGRPKPTLGCSTEEEEEEGCPLKARGTLSAVLDEHRNIRHKCGIIMHTFVGYTELDGNASNDVRSV